MAGVLDSMVAQAGWLVLSFALFGLLQQIRPVVAGQAWLRKDAGVDLIYWFAGPIAYGAVSVAFFSVGLMAMNGWDADRAGAFLDAGWGPFGDLPIWAQAGLALVISDFMLYWLHRWFHGPSLWRYHAVHHSPEEMDFLSAVRFHPVNVILYSVLTSTIVLWMGFDPLALAIMGPFNILYSGMVHANLDWDFGPFKKVFSSPIFHRWHHTGPNEGGNKNFAATFPLWDLMFGTYYMPQGKKPLAIGVVERDVPADFVGQMLYPFRRGPVADALEDMPARSQS